MKIRTKLMAMSGGSLLLLAGAAALYTLILSPLDRIDIELGYLDAIKASSRDLSSEVNRLASGPLELRGPSYHKAAEAYKASLAGLKDITYLPTLGEGIKSALDSLQGLEGMTSLDRLDTLLEQMLEQIKATFGGTGGQNSAMKLLAKLIETDDPAKNLPVTFASTISGAADILTLVIQSIDNQRATIATESAAIRNRAFTGVIITVVVVFVLVFIVSALIATSIARPLRKLQDTIAQVATGDLTPRIDYRGKDEIGAVAGYFNQLMETLNRSIEQIQTAARRNLEGKQRLSEAVLQASSSATQIEANSNSIKTQLLQLDQRIASGGAAIGTIDRLFTEFRERLTAQNLNVEDARSSIQRMAVAVGSIAQIAEDDLSEVQNLVEHTKTGTEVINHAFDKVNDISNQVDTIQEMAEVISRIADKTNILALNAAIEAAHAGELGKGFAVVADEIGKLAIAAAESSADITRKIAIIVTTIDDAVIGKEEATLTFQEINQNSQAVSQSFTGIRDGVVALQTESRKILTTMDTLQEHAQKIEGQSSQIASDTRTLTLGFTEAERISHEVASNIGEITIGLHEITTTVQSVSAEADNLGTMGRQMAETANCFHTTGDGCAEEQASP